MPYKHGTYGVITDSLATTNRTGETVAVYVGTAPIHLAAKYGQENLIHTPIKINSLVQAQNWLGHSDDFEKYTLCEAIAQHFDNAVGNVGPIYCINVFDPEDSAGEAKTESVTADGMSVLLTNEAIIPSTVTIADKSSDDYTVSYDFAKKGLVIRFAEPVSGTLSISYKEADPTGIKATDIIGTVSADNVSTGLQAVDLIYTKYNAVLNLLAAPGWSEQPAVYKAMIEKVQNLNGHWNGFVLADIPLVDAEKKAVDTIEKAITWKKKNGYNSKFSKVCWPMVLDNSGRKVHLSTVTQAKMMDIDLDNENIPFISPSNKVIDCTDTYFGATSKNQGYDQNQSNELNANGITTATWWGGAWKLWGGHTAAYEYGKEQDALEVFETNIRMAEYLTNRFQLDHADKIDAPMSIQLRNTILEEERDKLDYLKAIGALIGDDGTNFITFEPDEDGNEIMQGNFVFHCVATVAPQFKSGTVKVTYSDAGLVALYGE